MSWAKRVLIALDQLFGTLFLPNHQPDETISSRCWRWEAEGKLAWPRKLVDALFWFDKDHCRTSFEAEQRREHMPKGMR